MLLGYDVIDGEYEAGFVGLAGTAIFALIAGPLANQPACHRVHQLVAAPDRIFRALAGRIEMKLMT